MRGYVEKDGYNTYLYNCGVSGDTTEDLLKRFNIECEAREPDIIIFSIGANDSSFYGTKDKPRVSIQDFQNNLQELINQAKKFTSQIIFLGLTLVDESKTQPIPWAPTIHHDEENTKLYNQKIKEISEKNKLPFIEMFDLLDKNNLDDGLHPDSEGHEKMFLRVRDYLSDNDLI